MMIIMMIVRFIALAEAIEARMQHGASIAIAATTKAAILMFLMAAEFATAVRLTVDRLNIFGSFTPAQV